MRGARTAITPPTATTCVPAARLFTSTHLEADQPRRPWKPISCATFQDNLLVCLFLFLFLSLFLSLFALHCGVYSEPEAVVCCSCTVPCVDATRMYHRQRDKQAPWPSEDPMRVYAMQPFGSHNLISPHLISLPVAIRCLDAQARSAQQ